MLACMGGDDSSATLPLALEEGPESGCFCGQSRCGCSWEGLSDEEVAALRSVHGWNEISEARGSLWSLLKRCVKNWVVLLLVTTIIVTMSIPDVHGYRDWKAAGLLTLLLVLGIVGQWLSERRARDALGCVSLEREVVVRRAGAWMRMRSIALVPGDVVQIFKDELAVADGTLLKYRGCLEMNESSLTGESFGIVKEVDDTILCGSVCANGAGVVRVTHIGQDTIYGGTLALDSNTSEGSVLTRMLSSSSFVISVLAFVVSILLFLYVNITILITDIETINWSIALRNSLVLICSVTPTAMSVVTSTILSFGALKARPLVHTRRLCSLEELATCRTAVFDKTGTLTDNQIQVIPESCVTSSSFARQELLLVAKLVAHFSPPDDSLARVIDTTIDIGGVDVEAVAAGLFDKVGIGVGEAVGITETEADSTAPPTTVRMGSDLSPSPLEALIARHSIVLVDHVPANSNNRMSIIYVSIGGSIVKLCKGSLTVMGPINADEIESALAAKGLRTLCVCFENTHQQLHAQIDPHLGSDIHTHTFIDTRAAVESVSTTAAGGVPTQSNGVGEAPSSSDSVDMVPATSDVGGCKTSIIATHNWTLIGVLGLSDPIRNDSAALVSLLKSRGMSVRILTGDGARIAVQIATQLGITEVEAECYPKQKLEAVEALPGASLYVGDGVNDVPSLRRATVGVSVTRDARVARGADLVLAAHDLTLLGRAVHLSELVWERCQAYILHRVCASVFLLLYYAFSHRSMTPSLIVSISFLNDSTLLSSSWDPLRIRGRVCTWRLGYIFTVALGVALLTFLSASGVGWLVPGFRSYPGAAVLLLALTTQLNYFSLRTPAFMLRQRVTLALFAPHLAVCLVALLAAQVYPFQTPWPIAALVTAACLLQVLIIDVAKMVIIRMYEKWGDTK